MTTSHLSTSAATEVRAEMARQRMSQRQLAARLGTDQSWISRRLTGDVTFALDDLEVVADALGVSPFQLISPRAS